MKEAHSPVSSAWNRARKLFSSIAVLAFVAAAFPVIAAAQDRPPQDQQDQDDPPSRVARLGYMEGSVSFQPAGENDWVEAVPNRPMTTGDKLWSDRGSRAEVQLGSSMIDLGSNTGFSFLNLDDHTIQMEVTAGVLNVRVWHLDHDTNFEIDTPNQAFTISEPGRYRVETSENGDYTVVTVREGAGESSGNGQSYTLHSGQRTTFRGTTSLNADVEQIGPPDDFDSWSDRREHRYNDSPSARYCSRQVVGFEDLDDNGDWQPSPQYGNVWYPHVHAGWAPYHDGHWAWIDPCGWTWIDDARWGYAPFHYGRWVNVYGRWGWVPGPVDVRPVYAPALVVFVGGHPGGGANVAWFPLAPREVYVPAYRVSPGYVNRVNVSNTTVNQTTVTNVYNTTIINNNTTTINRVTYVNQNVHGAVTAMPQHAFASAQPVGRNAVRVNPREFRNAPVMSRAAVRPAPEAVLGPRAHNGGRVAAPPAAIANRGVFARTPPPPPPPAFAAREHMLAQHPGQPIGRQELARMAPPARPVASGEPRVRVVTPTRPVTPPPAANQPGNRPGGMPASNAPGRGGQPQPENERMNNQPGNRPIEPPGRNDRAMPAPNNRPENNRGDNNRPENNRHDNNRPEMNQPTPGQPAPSNRPEENKGGNRSFEPPARNDRPENAQPNNHPEADQPNNRPDNNRGDNNRGGNNRPNNRPDNNRPDNNRPEMNQPTPGQPAPNNRPEENKGGNRSFEPPARNDRPENAQPNNHPEADQPNNRPDNNRGDNNRGGNNRPNNRPDNNRPDNNRPEMNQPAPSQPAPNNRPEENRDGNRSSEPPARNDRPNAAPNNDPQPTQPAPAQPERSNHPDRGDHGDRSGMNRTQPRNEPAPQQHNEPAPRPQAPQSNQQQRSAPPEHGGPAQPAQQQHESSKPDKHDRK